MMIKPLPAHFPLVYTPRVSEQQKVPGELYRISFLLERYTDSVGLQSSMSPSKGNSMPLQFSKVLPASFKTYFSSFFGQIRKGKLFLSFLLATESFSVPMTTAALSGLQYCLTSTSRKVYQPVQNLQGGDHLTTEDCDIHKTAATSCFTLQLHFLK